MRARVRRWPVSEYEQLVEQGVFGKNVELIRGIVVEKMAKSPLHCSIAKWLYDRMLPVLSAEYVLRFESPLRLADSEPEPDVAIVRGTADDVRRTHPTTAELVVEIAVSSAALDRANCGLYAEAGVKEYWIVLAKEEQVEVFTAPQEGVYALKRVVARGEVLSSVVVPGIELPLGELFA